MTHNQQTLTRTHTQYDIAVFIYRMVWIVAYPSIFIIENSLSFFKRNSMLSLVALSFPFVPLKFSLTHRVYFQIYAFAIIHPRILYCKLVLIGNKKLVMLILLEKVFLHSSLWRCSISIDWTISSSPQMWGSSGLNTTYSLFSYTQ